MRLELSRRTQADLDDIRDYSVGRFGPRRTIDYLDAIEQTFRRVLDHPQIGVVHEALRGVRSLPTGEHRVYYSVAADTITIVRIKDGRTVLMARLAHRREADRQYSPDGGNLSRFGGLAGSIDTLDNGSDRQRQSDAAVQWCRRHVEADPLRVT